MCVRACNIVHNDANTSFRLHFLLLFFNTSFVIAVFVYVFFINNAILNIKVVVIVVVDEADVLNVVIFVGCCVLLSTCKIFYVRHIHGYNTINCYSYNSIRL